MRRTARAGLIIAIVLLSGMAATAAPRPDLNSGACLSCHARDVATLPSRPCLSCHAGNMAFLQQHDRGGSGTLWLIGAAGGGALLLAALMLIVGPRRILPAAACLAIAIVASSPANAPGGPELPDVALVASGFACDLAPNFAPDGSALLFARRGPDTSGDGTVDLRDGLALFLLRRGWETPKRLTPFALDAQGAMAAWAPDGSRGAVPLPASGDHPAGLCLFDARGRRTAFVPQQQGEILAPAFSPDGTRIAFVEGSGIALWDPQTGTRTWALEPLTEGQFPRLYGWSTQDDAPVFTRGSDYAQLERDREGARILPAEVPVEIASEGRALCLTPAGPTPLRRFKVQPVAGGYFYLAQGPQQVPGLYYFDGKSEGRWSPEGVAVAGFVAADRATCWAWTAQGEGLSRLVRFEGPGRFGYGGPTLKANLLATTASGPEAAWTSGTPEGCDTRALFRSGSGVPIGAGGPVFGLAAAGNALAVVTAEAFGASDRAEPWDRARLWVVWEAP